MKLCSANEDEMEQNSGTIPGAMLSASLVVLRFLLMVGDTLVIIWLNFLCLYFMRFLQLC